MQSLTRLTFNRSLSVLAIWLHKVKGMTSTSPEISKPSELKLFVCLNCIWDTAAIRKASYKKRLQRLKYKVQVTSTNVKTRLIGLGVTPVKWRDCLWQESRNLPIWGQSFPQTSAVWLQFSHYRRVGTHCGNNDSRKVGVVALVMDIKWLWYHSLASWKVE